MYIKMQTVTLHTNKCFNLYHISLINVTLCSSYCQYFQFLPLGGVPLRYICISNNPVTPTQLNNITMHITHKLYTAISFRHQLSVTVTALSSMLFLNQLDCIYYTSAPCYLSCDSSNANIDTQGHPKRSKCPASRDAYLFIWVGGHSPINAPRPYLLLVFPYIQFDFCPSYQLKVVQL